MPQTAGVFKDGWPGLHNTINAASICACGGLRHGIEEMAVRTWLGAGLVLAGLALLLPAVTVWVWASKQYTLGMGVNALLAIIASFALGLAVLVAGVVILSKSRST
jgi:hypothetical protein